MKSILKEKKGWFIFAYLVGAMYFTYYLVWRERSADSVFANVMLVMFAHIFIIGAHALCKSEARRKLLWRTLSIFVACFSTYLFFTPETMGMIGGYAMFCAIGFVHTKLLKEKEMFAHISKAATAEEASEFSDKQWKYIIWGAFSVLLLFLLYWNV